MIVRNEGLRKRRGRTRRKGGERGRDREPSQSSVLRHPSRSHDTLGRREGEKGGGKGGRREGEGVGEGGRIREGEEVREEKQMGGREEGRKRRRE